MLLNKKGTLFSNVNNKQTDKTIVTVLELMPLSITQWGKAGQKSGNKAKLRPFPSGKSLLRKWRQMYWKIRLYHDPRTPVK